MFHKIWNCFLLFIFHLVIKTIKNEILFLKFIFINIKINQFKTTLIWKYFYNFKNMRNMNQIKIVIIYIYIYNIIRRSQSSLFFRFCKETFRYPKWYKIEDPENKRLLSFLFLIWLGKKTMFILFREEHTIHLDIFIANFCLVICWKKSSSFCNGCPLVFENCDVYCTRFACDYMNCITLWNWTLFWFEKNLPFDCNCLWNYFCSLSFYHMHYIV